MNIDVHSSQVELGPEPERHGMRTLQPEGRSPLRVYFSHLWRQRWIIGGFALAGLILGLAYVSTLKPTFRSSSLLLLEGAETKPIEAESVVPLSPPDLETVNAEIAVIKSRAFSEKIIDQMRLDQNPEFSGDGADDALVSRMVASVKGAVKSVIGGVSGALGLSSEEQIILSEAAQEALRREALIDAYLRRLEARPAGRSRLIEIGFTSFDPELSANVVNAVSDFYISEQVRSKIEVTERAAAWLDDRLRKMRAEAESAERKAEQFRNESGLTRGEGGTLVLQEITALSAELTAARGARAEADVRLREGERALAGAGRGTTSEMLRSPIIQDLTRQLISLRQQETNLLKGMGERHPQVIAVRAQIQDMQVAISQETRSLLAGLRSDAAAARAREKMLSDQLEVLKSQTANLSQAEVQLRSYSANVDSTRATLDTLQTRLNEVILQRDILQPDARILSAAAVPTFPSGPNKPVLLILAAFFATAIGVVVGMVREAMDSRVRSADQLTSATGAPMLGLVPRLPAGSGRNRNAAARYLLEHPASAYAESINAILTAHLLRTASRSAVVTVTSSLPDEGKSLFSLSLARSAANIGKSVLLIEADMRRPSLQEFLGGKRKVGLSDVIRGEVQLGEALDFDPGTSLRILSCGTAVPNPLPLLGSREFVGLLQAARRSFDLVIVDGPPLLPVPDSRILAANADETIFIARWGKTPVAQALQALRVLDGSGANLRGIVVTQVNVKRHAEYGYSDSGQYHLGRTYYRN
jgi:succinoglycan biosynthesis transport protein ExoP